MLKSLTREFRLSPPGKGQGLSCAENGAFLDAIPLLKRSRASGKECWEPIDSEQLSEQISSQFGLPIDISRKTGWLKVIAKALNSGDLARAQIATVLLGVPDRPPLSKGTRSQSDMIKFIRDLHWSGMIKADWDPDEHPRWPAGAPDSQGGQFAPKGEGGEADDSPASQSDTGHRGARIELADAGMSDATDDPIAEAARAATAEAQAGTKIDDNSIFSEFPKPVPDDVPHTVLAAAEGEDEKDPRIGGNHPPPEELIPQRLQRSPAGVALQFLDNLLDITGPGDEANLQGTRLLQQDLLRSVHEIDPNYVYQSIEPQGGLAGMSWQGRLNVINVLRADLAGATYRARGDIGPLQEVTLDFMQRAANAAYDECIGRSKLGELNARLPPQLAMGNCVDGEVRQQLHRFYNGLGLPTDLGSPIRVNRRAYDISDSPPSYRVPDARVGNLAFDVSLEAKKPSKDQIRDIFSADFKPAGVVIVRPNQLGDNSSYVIWRRKGD